MCSSSSTRQNEQNPTTRPVGISGQKEKRHAGVLELRQIHLARPRIRERRFLDGEDVLDLGWRGDGSMIGVTVVRSPVRIDADVAIPAVSGSVSWSSRASRATSASGRRTYKRLNARRIDRCARRGRGATAIAPIAPASSGAGADSRPPVDPVRVQHRAVADDQLPASARMSSSVRASQPDRRPRAHRSRRVATRRTSRHLPPDTAR